MNEIEALLEFNLAPLSTRRDIAMLGVIHRAANKAGPEHLHPFFQRTARVCTHHTRRQVRAHSLNLADPGDSSRHLDIMSRSALGLVYVYNLLPDHLVQETEISKFQGALQEKIIKGSARAGKEGWEQMLSPRHSRVEHPLFSFFA